MRVMLAVSMVMLLATLSQAEEPGDCVDCHGGSRERYTTKKITFMEKVTFIHNTHYDKKKWIAGVDVYCTTCHQRPTGHFDVSKEACYLCHFKDSEFNENLFRCSLCHEIPAGPLQRQMMGVSPEEGSITHQSLDEAGVSCRSCHLEIVKGAGNVDKDQCLYCHVPDNRIMKESDNPQLMHKEHVSTLNARCFDCHEPIEHKKADFMEASRINCQACHPDHHLNQVKLLTGDITKEVPGTPGLMFAVKTNCMGCHIEANHDRKGEEERKGTAKACVGCHTDRLEAMLKEWKDKISEELEAVEEVRQRAEDVLRKAEKRVPEEELQQAKEMFEKGQEFMNTVRYGNGVHNVKYSITLLDSAFGNFEDLIDILGDEELN